MSNAKTLDGLTVVNASVVNTNVENVITENVTNLVINGHPFVYQNINFTPVFGMMVQDSDHGGFYTLQEYATALGQTPTITYNKMSGVGVRTGSICTVYDDIDITVSNVNANGVGSFYGFPSIRNLPWVCTGPINYTISDFEIGESSWPNGISNGAPAILVPTYPYPYTAEIHSQGEPVDLILNTWSGVSIIPVSKGTHTMTGSEIAITCTNEFYEVTVDVPPWALAATTVGPITTIHIIDVLIGKYCSHRHYRKNQTKKDYCQNTSVDSLACMLV